jgi:hypothetical protein
MAAEKKAASKAKKKKKVAKKKAAKKTRSTAKKTSSKAAAAKPAGAMKLVWVVCDNTGAPVKTFAYPERKTADAEATRLTSSKGKQHWVRNEKVPME